MIKLAQVKMATMAILVAIALLTAGWWSAMQVMADGNNAPPANGGAGPVDGQSPDAKYEACRQVFVSMIDAHDSDDAAAFNSQLYFSPSADPRLVRIAPTLIDLDLAVYRVQKAAIARFGAHAIGLRFYWTTTVVSFEDLLSRVERKDARISGDTVIFNPSEPFFPRDGIWPRAPVYFHNDNGIWKLDVARTVQIQFHFRRRVPVQGETEEQTLVAGEKGFTDAMNAISQDIENGKVESAGELQKRLDGTVIGMAMMFSVGDVNIVQK